MRCDHETLADRAMMLQNGLNTGEIDAEVTHRIRPRIRGVTRFGEAIEKARHFKEGAKRKLSSKFTVESMGRAPHRYRALSHGRLSIGARTRRNAARPTSALSDPSRGITILRIVIT